MERHENRILKRYMQSHDYCDIVHSSRHMATAKCQSVQFSTAVQSCPILGDPIYCSTPGFLVHHQLLELAQTHVHRVSDAIQPFHPLSSPSPHAFNLSQHQGFSNESVLHIRWPKNWSFSFSINPSKGYSELIPFRMDWFNLHIVQGNLKSLLQHPSSKASIFPCSAFFMGQLSLPYMTTGKTICCLAWSSLFFQGASDF